MDGTFKKRLKRSDALIGSIITVPSPEVGEIFARAGFDWLFVDLEHSTLSVREAQTILQAASPTPCIVRVPANDEVWIKKALDIGSAGLVIPLIKSAGDAEKAVRLCKYPPEGSRGVGLARAHGYGATFQEYVSAANEDLTVIIQIEHIDAVDHIDEIAKVKGIDGWFVGPYDLSASMGMPGATTAPAVLSAIGKVKKAAEQAKLAIGIYCSTGEAARAYVQDGYAFVTIGIDTLLVNSAVRQLLGSLKE